MNCTKMRCMVALSVVAMGFNAFAVARTNTVANGGGDWNSVSFSDASWLPGEGDDDTIIIPAGCELTVSDAVSTSFNRFKNLNRVILASETSRIIFDVSGEAEVGLPITSYGYITGNRAMKCGPIVKQGDGTLHFSSTSLGDAVSYDYYSEIVISNGVLKLPQVLTKEARYGSISIAAGKTLYLPAVPATVAATLSVHVNSFAGEGVVTNDTAKAYDLHFDGVRGRDNGSFGGILTGTYASLYLSSNCQEFMNPASTFNISAYIRPSGSSEAEIKVSSVGTGKGMNSSLGLMTSASGPNIWTQNKGGRLIYTGTGEAVTRATVLEGNGCFIIDGGEHGGLTWSGNIQRYYASSYGYSLVLAGAADTLNTMTATVSDQVDSSKPSGAGHGLYLSKEGAGTWLLAGTTRGNFSCGISVNEGVLQYASIAGRGEECALGLATNLTDHTTGASDNDSSHKVNYALRLGAMTHSGELKDSGRLEYVGSLPFLVTNREIAVAGVGGIRANGTAIQRFRGVYGVGTGEKTLMLDGSNANGCEVLDVSDGSDGGVVSIVKDGSGTWILGGSQTWTGDLSVKGGELIVRNPSHYSWYRMTITRLEEPTVVNATTNWLQVDEICLCDADGNMVSKGLQRGTDPGTLNPGTAILTTELELDPASNMAAVERLFDDVANNTYAYFKDGTTVPTGNSPETWITVTMHLPVGSPAVIGYDYFNHAKGRSGIAGYFIDASVDGIRWNRVKTNDPCSVRGSNGYWMYQFPTDFQKFGTGTHSKCDPFDSTAPATLPSVMASVRSYSVTGGGKLTLEAGSSAVIIASLKVDVASGGEIDGFSFAETGTIDIENCETGKSMDLPVAFLNAGDSLANLANWTVKFNGVIKPNSKLSVSAGGTVTVVPTGFIVIVK